MYNKRCRGYFYGVQGEINVYGFKRLEKDYTLVGVGNLNQYCGKNNMTFWMRWKFENHFIRRKSKRAVYLGWEFGGNLIEIFFEIK